MSRPSSALVVLSSDMYMMIGCDSPTFGPPLVFMYNDGIIGCGVKASVVVSTGRKVNSIPIIDAKEIDWVIIKR